ncbi:hypothetical protein [Paenochrobactrum pullorum]|uniref:hypothetical protein n=1 Tax=Paenochrobactrum pullorum TaxID=1324351 RepID=UPI0035BC54AD
MNFEYMPQSDAHPCYNRMHNRVTHRSSVYTDGRQHYCERCGEKINQTTFSNIPANYITTHDAGNYHDPRAAPDVPELVRYRLHWSDYDSADMEVDNMEGEYVLHSQAAALIAAERAKKEDAENGCLAAVLIINELKAKLAQHEAQEPVAWRGKHRNNNDHYWNYSLHPDSGFDPEKYEQQPLYASPLAPEGGRD